MQGAVAVVVELADRDAEPERVTDADHCVDAQRAEFTGSHAGAGENLDHQPTAPVRVGGERGHKLRNGRVVEELGKCLVGLWEVAWEHGDLAGCVVVVPSR